MKTLLRFTAAFAGLLFLSLAACSAEVLKKIPDDVKELFDQPDTVELVSLDPSKELQENEEFYGWKNLGSTKTNDPMKYKVLINALNKSAEENDGIVAGCFLPRHGLRLVKGNKAVDLVICFQCYSANYYIGGKKAGYFLVTGSALKVFNQALTDAKVRLPKQAGE